VEASHHLILLGSALVLLSIFAGVFSARFGAPLLLVFLGLGILAGEEGPGGILFHDFHAAYLIGSVALAIILFDGGLRTDPKMSDGRCGRLSPLPLSA
jgi:cell volume regulation protein A